MSTLFERLADRLWPTPAPVLDEKAGSGPLVAINGLARPAWSSRNYAGFAREGMMQNAVVYRCIRMMAEAAASVRLEAHVGREVVPDHPLLDLIEQPAAGRTRFDFFEHWYGTLLVSGNVFVHAAATGDRIRELHLLRPDRTTVIAGRDGWPDGVEYHADGRRIVYDGEAITGVDQVLHVKLFHPSDDHYGLSPVEPAASAIDIHNAASLWSKALLDNAARPSGALVYTAGGHLSGDQYERLRSELEQSFQGARNAGRPMLLEGGLDWKAMSLSPRDMDFVEAKNSAAREIALALGVPPMLLGIPGDNTYANYQEANRSFWRQSVLPLVERTARALSAWLAPAYPDRVILRAAINEIDALAPEREALWRRLEAASFLTEDEKRAAVGYGELTDGSDDGA